VYIGSEKGLVVVGDSDVDIVRFGAAAARSMGRPAAAAGSAAAIGDPQRRRRGGLSSGGGEVANTPPRRVGTSPRGPRAAHLREAPVVCAAGGEGRFPQVALACGIWPYKSSEGI
jgi:hypothetical protein